jgi:LacI family transcriptional regulator
LSPPVLFDNADGAERGVEHLIAHGHRRIAWLSDRETLYTAGERLTGYRRALRAAGIPSDSGLIRTGLHHAGEAAAALRDLLELSEERRPTAVLAANNRNTVGALRALRGHRHELALVGIDDFELADVLTPAVTVVRTYPERLAAVATDRVFARLHRDQRPPERLIVPSDLVVRGSGEIAP